MKLGVILPNTKLYGGVKRFFELGDVFQRLGNEFSVFTPDGSQPTWYSGQIKVASFSDLHTCQLDALFITETRYAKLLEESSATRKIMYHLRPDSLYSLKNFHDPLEIFSNSTDIYNYIKQEFNIESFKAFGGINTKTYFPKPVASRHDGPIKILTYGRLIEKKKGTALVVKACERLTDDGFNIKLILFDAPVNQKARQLIDGFKSKTSFEFVLNHPVDRLVELYHRADLFVSAEEKAGHSNTVAEAMASGIPVIASASGSKDFLLHGETGLVIERNSKSIADAIKILVQDSNLRSRLAEQARKKIELYNWDTLGQSILSHLVNTQPSRLSFDITWFRQTREIFRRQSIQRMLSTVFRKSAK
jgi:glycosyltransferase involved in cell wall biosynthesis